VARAAGLDELEHEDVIEAAILDAQADVTGYLGREITVGTYTETGRMVVGDEWDLTPLEDPVIAIGTVTAETYPGGGLSGYYTVTYTAGLDAATDPVLAPIRRYVKAHALNSPELHRLWVATSPPSTVTSVSTEGQSVSYSTPTLGGGGPPGSGAPGALPTLGSLSRWRRISVSRQRQPVSYALWPHRPMDT
jgi:hypothetical protein